MAEQRDTLRAVGVESTDESDSEVRHLTQLEVSLLVADPLYLAGGRRTRAKGVGEKEKG